MGSQDTNESKGSPGQATRLKLRLGPMAMDLDDLRQVERRMAAMGEYSVRRFDESFGSLEEFQQACEGPYQCVIFLSPAMELRLSSAEALIFYEPESADDAEALEKLLDSFREPPLVRFRYLHFGIIFVTAMVAARSGQYLVPLLCLTLFALFGHVLADANERKGVLRRPSGVFNDSRIIWALFCAGMGIATLLGKLIEG